MGMGGVEMTTIAWVVEQSLQASERFRHLTVTPTHFLFECGGVRCLGKRGECYIAKDSKGEVRMIYGVWREL